MSLIVCAPRTNIRLIKLRRIWARHVARKGRGHFADPGVDGLMIKCVWDEGTWAGLTWL